jgi:hypothetical protein
MSNVKTKAIPVIGGTNETITESFRKYLNIITGAHKIEEL